MYISGWGNNLVIKSNVIYPKNINEIIKIVKDYKYKGILVRGMGRSYYRPMRVTARVVVSSAIFLDTP